MNVGSGADRAAASRRGAGLTAAWRGLAAVGGGLADLLYPPACAVCDAPRMEPATYDLPICAACWAALPVSGRDVCLRCGMPQQRHVGPVEHCPACPPSMGRVRQTVALGRYVSTPAVSQDPNDGAAGGTELRDLVLRLKFGRRVDAARVLGGLLAGEIAARPWRDRVDWVVPVPLHWRRQFERRYNQAELIAGTLARRLGYRVVPLLRRVRDTPTQTSLAPMSRASNVDGAFAMPSRWRRWVQGTGDTAGRVVLLVDDVITTGATLRACAQTLYRAGVKDVYAAVAARA